MLELLCIGQQLAVGCYLEQISRPELDKRCRTKEVSLNKLGLNSTESQQHVICPVTFLKWL